MNDANVLIDLIELDILEEFFDTQMECHTVSLILEELYDDQKESLQPYIDSNQLHVHELTEDELQAVIEIRSQQISLSEQDCSAYYRAISIGAVLLTSDRKLRRFAETKKVEVHGHLWIFDRMVEEGTLSHRDASEKLIELCDEINPRLGLPDNECQKRHKYWNSI